jgi:ParB family chromosome partitioning protein
MASKIALGRGLGSLIQQGTSTEKQPAATTTSVPQTISSSQNSMRLPVKAIERNPFQPRTHFDEEGLVELTESIRQHGVLQPLLVRRVGNTYQLISGERRLRASTTAGLTEVPVILVEAADEQSLEIALVENLQRRDLGSLEEAEGYRQLAARFALTQTQIAERVGRARASIANALRLLSLPQEIQAAMRDGQLSTGHAKLLASIESAAEQMRLGRQAIKDQLSVRALEELIKKQQAEPRKPRTSKEDMPKAHVALLSEKLHTHFGSNVTLVPSRTYANGKKAPGRISVDFYSNDDLTRILDVLKIQID